MATPHVDTVILGAGLAGLSTALHLGDDYLLLEREDHVGGLAHTFLEAGHQFDITGHWLHLRDQLVKDLMTRLLGDELVQRVRRARVFSHGVYTQYPYQANTFGLPAEVAADCVTGFLKARAWDRMSTEKPQALAEPETFADFIIQRLGEGIAKHFMFPYNQKLWTVHPREMDASWCQRFVPVPSLEDVVLGALGRSPQALGYNTHFMYPKTGGIARVPQAIHQALPRAAELNAEVIAIDLTARSLTLKDGRSFAFDQLVSTAPLNHLLGMIADLPDEIRAAATVLRHSTITYFDVAAKGANPDQPHWAYVPEPDKPFYRIGSFSAVEPSMAPAEQRNFYVEIAHQGPELKLADAESVLVRQLVEMQLIEKEDDIQFIKRRHIPVAYVLPGADVEPARQKILAYLDAHKLRSTGRYGAWVYAAMEDAIIDGIETAEQLRLWRKS